MNIECKVFHRIEPTAFGFLPATMMHWQPLISILVFVVAVLCFTRVVSGDTIRSQKLELANKLTTLVQHPGWRQMDYVKIKKHRRNISTIEDPMSTILETLSLNGKPFNEFNVLERYREISTVLKCKYAEVIYKSRSLVQHFIRVCRNEKTKNGDKTTDYSLQNYYECFRLLLVKLHSISPRFKCMADALEFFDSLGIPPKSQSAVTVATEKLTAYTSTVGPSTSSRLSDNGINEYAVDLEIKSISEYFLDVINVHIARFSNYNCDIRSHTYWSTQVLNEDFELKKKHKLIPEETTMVQYVRDEMDSYINDILSSCFFDLGLAYDLTGNVIIRNI